ncbi:MAG: helix-turn-helix transcriptional regulator [Clostridium septicum]|uniref:helix-turn-helix domain-containing protein n=1 Tax=Clostridium septicum TaxID=1504 RepID=UPI0025859E3E|nr:helix-turn-helix transcriptional regulator [Clostridium septicum]MDU1313901.1 helix-turn-helix transcriptional regulator [Clostridium septicum]
MEVKDIIKKRREELSLTYEQLGNMIGVGKSTVRKWETGLIENMRRDNIVALSKALNISPAIIMGWQPIEDDNKLILSKEEIILIDNYNELDAEDKNKVVDYTKLLSNQDKYKKEDNKVVELPKKRKEIWEEEGKEHLMPVAAHDRDGEFTEEDYKHDDDLMKNDDFWK